jgi:dTDP-4-dehydrorhamnose 3,5-epimerase-like enzyme
MYWVKTPNNIPTNTHMGDQPMLVKGGHFTDERGTLRFVNDFDLKEVKRFYFIKHPDTSFVRAWQGHQFEQKYFYPITGSFVVAWVKLNDYENPSDELIPEYHILTAANCEILAIPKGYANGLKALEPNSEIMIFSDMYLEESVDEKIRYPSNKWFDWTTLSPSPK